MVDRPDWLTAALTVVFFVTLTATAAVNTPVVWLGWATAMVLLAGGALVLTNRSAPPDNR
ncbi:hypothetical protein [Natronorubrum aibiense]|uniref:Uncharacterized protein n=1 Tax=Natronorubrum aibiense TaxID=348826 RepID=A0A5P9P6P3_9EURY|nr:hypothetical protein [Natronorubrum aibiense]QFU83617.1 hypothetical protein GCU68_14240 [Natronorubrum aibiense]